MPQSFTKTRGADNMNSIVEAAQARLDELHKDIALSCEQAKRRIEMRYRQDLAELQQAQQLQRAPK